MEAGTTPAEGTGSATIADMCLAAAAKYGDQVAIQHKVDGAWRDVTFAQVGEIVTEIGLERRDVIAKCMEMGVPIFQGRIDKTLFLASLQDFAGAEATPAQATA